jgi:beta-1,2-mannosidase
VTATRVDTQPLLGPGTTWAGSGRFNPAAVRMGGKTVLLFRARDASGTSRIGYAESTDGRHFTARPDPVLSPEAEYEKDGGVEDPRVILIDATFYLTYTAYNRHDAQLCLATSTDLLHWKRQGVIMPAYKGKWNTQWTKSGAILPQRVNGRWWMYYMGTQRDSDGKTRDHMGLASSPDLLHWSDATDQPVLPRRAGAFDSRVMEPGPAPILTAAGILLLYNGADDNLVYGPGWILFDAHDPAKLIARSDKPFILPELDWERRGAVPNVIFLEGVVAGRDPLDLTGYYGAADSYIGALQLRITLPRR